MSLVHTRAEFAAQLVSLSRSSSSLTRSSRYTIYSIPTSTLSARPILSPSSSSSSSVFSGCISPPSIPTEGSLLLLRANGMVFHILSRVSLSRMRDLMADALCICRLFLSLAVIGLELLLLDTAERDLLPLGLVDACASLVDRRRDGPAGGASASRCCLIFTCSPSAGLATTWGRGFRTPGIL